MGDRKIGKYQIQEIIGRGGMGVVYKAVQISLNRPVAIKALPAQIDHGADAINRLKKEATILARLQHPNIVTIFDIVRQTDEDFLIMEFIPGKTLAQLLREQPQNRFAPEHAVTILSDVASALAHAHKHHIIHRDVKPANIMITPEGVVKVTDFGVARLASGHHMTQTGLIQGTPHYMSPEQIKGDKDIDGRSDIYSLGIVFYEMLTGRAPFAGHSEYDVMVKQVKEDPVRPTEVLGNNTLLDYEDIILKCIAKNREERFQTADELIRALHSVPTERQRQFVLSGHDRSQDEETRAVVPPHKARQRLYLRLAAVLGGIVALSVVANLFWPQRPPPVHTPTAPEKEIVARVPEKKEPDLRRELQLQPSLSPRELVKRQFKLKIRFDANSIDANEAVAGIRAFLKNDQRVQITDNADYELYFVMDQNDGPVEVRYSSRIHNEGRNSALQEKLLFENTRSMIGKMDAIVKRDYCFKILRSLQARAENQDRYRLDLAIYGGQPDRLKVGQKIDICLKASDVSHGILFGVDLEGIYLIPPQPGKITTRVDAAGSTCLENIEVAAAMGTEMVFAIGAPDESFLSRLPAVQNDTVMPSEWSFTDTGKPDAVEFCERLYLHLRQTTARDWAAGTQFITTRR